MRRVLAVTSLVVLAFAPPVSAAPEDVANSISMEVMSPFCDGVTLHDCPSEQADELRERIRAWAESGMTRNEIIVRLQDDYGVGIAAAPQPRGLGLLAWAIPVLAVLAGAGLAFVLVRRWSTRSVAPATAPADESERERLRAEIAALRSET